MADTDFTEYEAPKFAHEPHIWHRSVVDKAQLPGRAVATFANHVVNIAGGLQCVSSLLAENQDLTDGEDPERPPVLTPNDCNMLQRLITASLADIQEKAHDILTWAYEQHTPEGKKERREIMAHCAKCAD
jgi:hypothetical protein